MSRVAVSLLLGWPLLAASWPVAAHTVPPSVVMLDIGRDTVDLELQLQLSELGIAMDLPLAADPDTVIAAHGDAIERYVTDRVRLSAGDGRAFTSRSVLLALRHTDNRDWLSNDWLVVRLRMLPPPGVSTAAFGLDYSVIVQPVSSHNAMIYVRNDLRNAQLGADPLPIGLVGFQQTHLEVDGSRGSWWQGFGRLFRMGMHHIGSGPDHLLFLLVLLLPATQQAQRGRWQGMRPMRESLIGIVRLVTGFTLGHSVTLALASLGWIGAPTGPVELLIAVSILVSAVHAWRPLFPGRELWVAGLFGLVHGLAFATVLAGLRFDGWTLAVSLAGFNLGIETMQLLVVAAALPLLLRLNRMRYRDRARQVGAAFAAACALGWMGERGAGLLNPLQPLIDWLSAPPDWAVWCVCAASLACATGIVSRHRTQAAA